MDIDPAPLSARELSLIQDMKAWKAVGPLGDGQVLVAHHGRRIDLMFRRLNPRGRWSASTLASFYGRRRHELSVTAARAIVRSEQLDRKRKELR